MANPPHPTPLGRVLADEIRRGGPMPFAAFMARCLYDPEHGYYLRPGREIGRGGDFFTAASVGPVLGELLADHAAAVWEQMARPAGFHILEQGAHRGDLMADVLGRLAAAHPALARSATAVMVEPAAVLRAAQERRLAQCPVPVRWVGSLAELAAAPLTGFFYCNELLDAFPVDRLRFDGAAWHRLGVGVDADGGFCWVALRGPLPPAPAAVARSLGTGFPAGYTTEVCAGLDPWVRDLAAALERGRVVILDYARVAADYFAPHRADGTLRGYRNHRRCDDPFAAPGETDLTADVNESHLRAAAARAGFTPGPLERQEAFLTRLAVPRLRAFEGSAVPPGPARRTWLRQFQTLTHPGLLGRAFSAVELVK